MSSNFNSSESELGIKLVYTEALRLMNAIGSSTLSPPNSSNYNSCRQTKLFTYFPLFMDLVCWLNLLHKFAPPFVS
jgi:hypothetical protein